MVCEVSSGFPELTFPDLGNRLKSRRFWTPTRLQLPSGRPPRTPLAQALPLGNQTLMNRAGEQGDAVPAYLVAAVLTGDTDA